MNSLGLEYSSDEEEAVSEPETKPVTVASAISNVVDSEGIRPTESPVLVRPSKKSAEVAVECAGPDASVAEEDDETKLLRAGIPPAVDPLSVKKETQQRIERFLSVQRERVQDFQTTLQDKKEVRNPYILEKVVEYFGINELHSNFSPDIFDPHGLPLHEYADALAVEQKKRSET
ncbi:hypothetical protein PsorP6_008344 [Peronosclerospora sorghi]|uniref:Uncharacterized protein n=1 Tax=Peronosclerospora sorghi TaxID=230839 RepID=A0ACC0WC92_9STRA|nr:hypothetical protein PsorP6_008344 [Peronosclerospora sorghi]